MVVVFRAHGGGVPLPPLGITAAVTRTCPMTPSVLSSSSRTQEHANIFFHTVHRPHVIFLHNFFDSVRWVHLIVPQIRWATLQFLLYTCSTLYGASPRHHYATHLCRCLRRCVNGGHPMAWSRFRHIFVYCMISCPIGETLLMDMITTWWI